MEQAARDPRRLHARELVALASGEAGPIELDAAEPLLDAAAKKQLAARLEQLADERDRAVAADALDRAAALDDEFERILELQTRTNLSRQDLARMLGVDPKTLRSRLKEIGVALPAARGDN